MYLSLQTFSHLQCLCQSGDSLSIHLAVCKQICAQRHHLLVEFQLENRQLLNFASFHDLHAFVNSNKRFKVMTVQLKREGKGGIDHHPPIEADDLNFFILP
jgi:hypothetical protein